MKNSKLSNVHGRTLLNDGVRVRSETYIRVQLLNYLFLKQC